MISFEQVSLLELKMLSVHNFDYHQIWDNYISILAMCGWDKNDYEKELLKRIDISWENSYDVN